MSAGLQVSLDQALSAHLPGKLITLLLGAYIAPDQCGADDAGRFIEHDRAMHLPGETDTGDLIGGDFFPAFRAWFTAMPQARHQSAGSCSAHPIFGEVKAAWSSVADARMRAALADDQGAGAACSDIDSKNVHVVICWRT